jgi:hypothetical protein
MRAMARVFAAVSLAAAGVAVAAVPAQADTAFQAQTAATGVHVTITQQPASSIITASLVDDATAYAASAFDSSGGSEAQAASVFPGSLVVEGPALFCSQLFPCPAAPPDYPLLADASYPRRASAKAAADQQPVGSGPLVVTTGSSTATAGADGNRADTASGGASILSGTPLAVTVGSSRSSSVVTSTSAALVTHVESVASDIDIGGQVQVATVRAVDDIRVPSSGKPSDAPHIVVSGVTVAGVPASIDENGLHVAGTNGPSLAQRVAQLGFDVRTVGVTRTDGGGVARSEATALVVSFSVPVSGLPYIPNPAPSPFDQVPGVNANGTYLGRITLGAVGAVAGANAEPAFGLGAFPLGTPPGAAAAPAHSAAAPAPPPGGAVVAAPAQPPQVSAPTRLFRAFLDGFTTDIADLYAVLALGTAVLFVGWRGIVALRRAGRTVGSRQ